LPPLSYNEPMRSLQGKLRLSSGVLLASFVLCWVLIGHPARELAQDASQQFPAQPGQTPRVPFGQQQEPNPDPAAKHAQEEAAKLRNAERQKRLVTDTDKLLQLAQELKTEVDKSNKDTLSLSVVKKAEEIEKLAKSVKDRMKAE
jgi:hypothetical protein